MKRFRVPPSDFDSRAATLADEIQPTWAENIKQLHRLNQINAIAGVIAEYGAVRSDEKIANMIDLGNAPFSILAFHNKFYHQARDAFIIGAYYPALTGACALGERILNHLLLRLRTSYATSPRYKKVYRKNSFDNWNFVIETLEEWEVLLPEVAAAFRNLAQIRNEKAIHFKPETDENARDFALEALRILSEIINKQFGASGNAPWFIPNTKGCYFIKKEAEKHPFIQQIYLPQCILVGPYHKVTDIRYENGRYVFVISDDFPYEGREISDTKFVELFEAAQHANVTNPDSI